MKVLNLSGDSDEGVTGSKQTRILQALGTTSLTLVDETSVMIAGNPYAALNSTKFRKRYVNSVGVHNGRGTTFRTGTNYITMPANKNFRSSFFTESDLGAIRLSVAKDDNSTISHSTYSDATCICPNPSDCKYPVKECTCKKSATCKCRIWATGACPQKALRCVDMLEVATGIMSEMLRKMYGFDRPVMVNGPKFGTGNTHLLGDDPSIIYRIMPKCPLSSRSEDLMLITDTRPQLCVWIGGDRGFVPLLALFVDISQLEGTMRSRSRGESPFRKLMDKITGCSGNMKKYKMEIQELLEMFRLCLARWWEHWRRLSWRASSEGE